MLLATDDEQDLGSADARLRFAGAGGGTRRLTLDGEDAFTLSFWCGTCPFLFQREPGAKQTVSLQALDRRLAGGLDAPDPDVLAAYGRLLEPGRYRPLLLSVTPRLQRPAVPGDYFSEDQVRVWGIDPFWDLPEHPRTPYYRTLERPLGPDHRGIERRLYEFVVPMVPPSLNAPERTAEYERILTTTDAPTAVALTTLDICLPAMDDHDEYVEHWCLTHFLLDGHHKMAAAAATGRPLRLLALWATEQSLATAEERAALPGWRA